MTTNLTRLSVSVSALSSGIISVSNQVLLTYLYSAFPGDFYGANAQNSTFANSLTPFQQHKTQALLARKLDFFCLSTGVFELLSICATCSSSDAACRCTQPEWVAAHGSWAVTALNGHINFHIRSAPVVETAHAQQGGLTATHPGSDATCVQGPGPLPESSSIAAVAEQTNTEQSEPASRPDKGEEEKVAVGNRPTSSVDNIWTDPVDTSTLQQAIADQPPSPLAEPFDLVDGDPANQRPSEAAPAGTGKITPAAQYTTPALPNDRTVAVGASRSPQLNTVGRSALWGC